MKYAHKNPENLSQDWSLISVLKERSANSVTLDRLTFTKKIWWSVKNPTEILTRMWREFPF